MKKYTWSIRILLPMLAILLVAGAYAGAPAIRLWWYQQTVDNSTENYAPDTPYSVEEENILKELIAVCGYMDSVLVFTVEGNMQASDPTDSANVLNTHFRYCRNGDATYYQTGNNEVATLKDAYISVNGDAKKILLSPPKEILPGLQLPADSILRIWKEDRYIVSRSITPPLVTINLLCENHITCKQYRFIYNQDTRLLHEVFMRLTDLNDPLNKQLDKPVRISYQHWQEGQVPAALFRKEHYLDVQQGSYVPSASYAGYELMSSN
jgi:hypothetical protein